MEIWVRPSGPVAAPSSQRGGSESSRDSEQDGELVSLSASEVRTSVSSGSSTAGSSGFISAYTETQEVQLYLSKFISLQSVSSVVLMMYLSLRPPSCHLSSSSGNIL